jgi:hypothetical protein
VTFAKELSVLQQQLLSFPTGRIDVPNALAYALRMRPGIAIYDNFGFDHVADDLPVQRGTAVYLALNATRLYCTGVLVQLVGGAVHISGAYVREGDPGTVLSELLVEARLMAAGKLVCYAPVEHWTTFDAVGLRPAVNRVGARLSQGGSLTQGREGIRKRLASLSHGQPALQVSSTASWALNAFAGGYATSITKGKIVDGSADEGIYKTLMEGLEAFMAVAEYAMGGSEDKRNYAIDGATGRRYLTARPQSEHHGETKIQGRS